MISAWYAKASISARNLAGAYTRIFTCSLVSHNAHNHPMDVLTAVFRCSRLCYNGYLTALPKIACFKTIGYFCLIAQYKYAC